MIDKNQSILKEISPGCSLEGLMLKLKLQYFDQLCEELTHLKRPWCWERLWAGAEGDYRGWDGWMASPTQWTWVWVDSRSWWWTGRPDMLQSMGSQRVGHNWGIELNRAEIDRYIERAFSSGNPLSGHTIQSNMLVFPVHTFILGSSSGIEETFLSTTIVEIAQKFRE